MLGDCLVAATPTGSREKTVFGAFFAAHGFWKK
jgi:hypothetical protein